MANKTVDVDTNWKLLERGPVTIGTITYDGDGTCSLVTSDDPNDASSDGQAFAMQVGSGSARLDLAVAADRYLWATVGMGRGGKLKYSL